MHGGQSELPLRHGLYIDAQGRHDEERPEFVAVGGRALAYGGFRSTMTVWWTAQDDGTWSQVMLDVVLKLLWMRFVGTDRSTCRACGEVSGFKLEPVTG